MSLIRGVLLAVAVAVLVFAGSAGAARIVAMGDVHGTIDGLEVILRAAELTDADGRWVGGDTIFVQTGDLTDRGPRVRAVLDRMRSLETEAATAGGRVVALLGNHEVSNLAHLYDEHSTPAEVYRQIWADFATADSERRQRDAYKLWRRWQRRYPACGTDDKQVWLDAHPPGFIEYVEALSAEGEYGRWLRDLPVVAEIDGNVFLHGGLSPEMIERGYDSLAAINTAAGDLLRRLDEDRRWLAAEGIIVPFSTLQEMHCALVWEIGRLEEATRAKQVERRERLTALRQGLPGMPDWLLTDEAGPVWFRGLATWEESEKQAEVERILDAYDAKRIVMGHTPAPGKIRSRFADRILLIDTAMAYGPEIGGRGAALEIDGERLTAIYPDGREVLAGPPVAAGAVGHGGLAWVAGEAESPASATAAAPAAAAIPAGYDAVAWTGPDGEPLPFAGIEEVLDYLASAKVVDSDRIATGVTLPRKLLLEREGVRAHAVFHDVKIEKRRERLRGGQVVTFFRDHYANNVAAFELSRLLGMTNVPPAVLREVRNQEGSVQLWIENTMTEAERRRDKAVPVGSWRLAAHDMWVFDNLINNIDRNQGNILYDPDWNLWLIDHTRAFGRVKTPPAAERIKRCSRRLWQALRELDAERVEERLGDYLGIYEIAGMMERRDRLVELIERKIAEEGEDAVLFRYEEPPADDDTGDAEIPEAPDD